jgi:hypothetical protein
MNGGRGRLAAFEKAKIDKWWQSFVAAKEDNRRHCFVSNKIHRAFLSGSPASSAANAR